MLRPSLHPRRIATVVLAATLSLALVPAPSQAVRGTQSLPSAFTLTGSGWGHGVGLSQYGAQAMARDGKSASAILRHYFQGTRIGRYAPERMLEVNVRYQPSAFSLRLRALRPGAELTVCAIRKRRCSSTATFTDGSAGSSTAGSVVFTRSRDQVRAVVRGPKGRTSRLTGRTMRVRWSGTRHKGGAGSVIRLDNGREYRRGQLKVLRAGSSGLNANLRLRLQQDYLRGIAEMPSSWEQEALRAQAIIARTYALRTGGSLKSDCGCHLRDSVVHQVYAGWDKENEGVNGSYGKRWISAVNATATRVVRFRGQLATTFYYSSSGGQTLNSEDVWASSVPYLRSVDDPWSVTNANPNRTWKVRFSQAQIASMFGMRKVSRLAITERHQGGALKEVTAYGPRQTRRMSGKADTMRIRFGLKSAWVKQIRMNR